MGRATSSGRLLLAGALLASGAFASPACASVPVCESRHRPPSRPLKSVSLDLPFYFFDQAGRFYRANFGNDTRRLISDHHFRPLSTDAGRSRSGRYVIYSGRLESNGEVQYWVYDKRSGTDRLLRQIPRGAHHYASFSPDGKQTAIMVVSPVPNRGWKPRTAILQLTDNASGQTRQARFPGDIPMLNHIPIPWEHDSEQSDIFWSRDGDALLAYFSSHTKKGSTQEYYSVNAATLKPEQIGGRPRAHGHPVFLDGTRRIPADDDTVLPLRSVPTHPELRSPDGSWIAFRGFDLKKDFYTGIYVRGRKGTTKQIYRSRNDVCDSAYVMAWLNSRYFLYRTYTWSTYIGDARTGRSKELFPDSEVRRLFDW